jgi:hypothetical protein
LLLHVVRNFSYYNKFNSFPNRHLRSNAVVLRRSLLTRFFVHVDMPRTKRQAHVIESGKTGLSANLASNGLRLVVAGRDDIIYPDSQWPLASTFRSGTQHNLLVADNRTQSYDNSSSDSKRHLESITWGAPPSQD